MKKDLSTKALTRCRDIFSDICNVNLFGDERFLEPEQLELIPSDTVPDMPPQAAQTIDEERCFCVLPV